MSGNVAAAGKVELLGNAVVAGDINTKYFTMKDTACLRGVVHLEDSGRNVAMRLPTASISEQRSAQNGSDRHPG